MAIRLAVDIEKLVIDYLLDVDEVTDIVDDRIGSKRDAPYPRLVIGRVGGNRRSTAGWVDRARIQVEAWTDVPPEGSKPAANLLARTAEAALLDIVNHFHEAGVVTNAQSVLGPVWQPDPKTARPRYIVDVIVGVHPHPTS